MDGQFIVNPTFAERKHSKLDLIVAGSKDAIVMVEAGAKEVTEEDMVTALDTAHSAIKQIVAGIEELAKVSGKKKLSVNAKHIDADFHTDAEAKMFGPLADNALLSEKFGPGHGMVFAVTVTGIIIFISTVSALL